MTMHKEQKGAVSIPSKSIEEILINDFKINPKLITNDVIGFTKIAIDAISLYAYKNSNYGNSFDKGIQVIGLPYATGRIFDKTNRIINMTKDINLNSDISVESLQDTLIDLGCYSFMLLNYLNKRETT